MPGPISTTNKASVPEGAQHTEKRSNSYQFDSNLFRPSEVSLHTVPRAEWKLDDGSRPAVVGDRVKFTVGKTLKFGEVIEGSQFDGIITAMKIDGGYYHDDFRYHRYQVNGKWIFEPQIDFKTAEITKASGVSHALSNHLEPVALEVAFPDRVSLGKPHYLPLGSYDLVCLHVDQNTQVALKLESPLVHGQVVAILIDSSKRGDHRNGNIYFVGNSYNPKNVLAIPEEGIDLKLSRIMWASLNGAALGDEISCQTNLDQNLKGRVGGIDFYSEGYDRITINNTSYPANQVKWETLRVLKPFHPSHDQHLVKRDFL